jgi:hypothetical protein
MSEDKKKIVQPKKLATSAGFHKVIVEMPAFKPEPFSEREEQGSKVQVYTGTQLNAEILGARNFGAMKDAEGRPMTNDDGEPNNMIALVLKLDADCNVVGRDQKPIMAKKGDTILWFATVQARQAIMNALRLEAGDKHQAEELFVRAMNGEYGIRIECMPQKQIEHPKNKNFKMWTYEIAVHESPVKREGALGLGKFFAQFQASAAQVDRSAPTLPAPNGTVLPATNS